jgi:FkbM family methyltransferase
MNISDKKIHDYEDFDNLFKNLIHKNDWCLDIGSNDGKTTLTIARILNNSGKIICFEPISDLLKISKDKLKEYENIDYHSYACDNKYTKKQFSYGINSSGGNGGLWDGYGEKERGISSLFMEVECIDTSDFLIRNYGLENLKNNLKFIKIDCEGHDHVIIKNLKPIIDICKPIIFCEWWFYESVEKLFDVVEEIKYEAFRSDNGLLAQKEFIGKGYDWANFRNKMDIQQSHDLILKPKNE